MHIVKPEQPGAYAAVVALLMLLSTHNQPYRYSTLSTVSLHCCYLLPAAII